MQASVQCSDPLTFARHRAVGFPPLQHEERAIGLHMPAGWASTRVSCPLVALGGREGCLVVVGKRGLVSLLSKPGC